MTRQGEGISAEMDMNKHENISDFKHFQGEMDLPFALNKCFLMKSESLYGRSMCT